MPGTNRKMPKKMRGGGMAAKPKAAPMKKGGAAKKKTTAKIIPRGDNLLRNPGGGFVKKDGGALPTKAPDFVPAPKTTRSAQKLKDLPLRKKDGGAVKKMRGGGMMAKPKAAPMKKGGGVTKSRVRSSSKKAL